MKQYNQFAMMMFSFIMLSACVLALKVIPVKICKASSSGLSKRNLVTDLKSVDDWYYTTNATVGSPAQLVTFNIDTGSSDTWVMDSSLTLSTCRDDDHCGGVFDPTKSESFKKLNNVGNFIIHYADGTNASGEWIEENVAFLQEAPVYNARIGLVTKNNGINTAMMGIGYELNEVSPKKYPNILIDMLSEGLIGAKVFSLYLDNKEDGTGEILFGGIDTEKFVGVLRSVPILKDEGQYRKFLVNLSYVAPESTNISSSNHLIAPLPVLLDSGTTFTYLPHEVMDPIAIMLNTVKSNTSVYTLIDCNSRSLLPDFVLVFGFGSKSTHQPTASIRVPLSELIFDGVTTGENPFKDTCIFGIICRENDFVLGDSFLRSAYVVYDLDRNEIGFAQTNFQSDGTNVVEVGKDHKSLPALTGVSTGLTQVPSTHFTTVTTSAVKSREITAPATSLSIVHSFAEVNTSSNKPIVGVTTVRVFITVTVGSSQTQAGPTSMKPGADLLPTDEVGPNTTSTAVSAANGVITSAIHMTSSTGGNLRPATISGFIVSDNTTYLTSQVIFPHTTFTVTVPIDTFNLFGPTPSTSQKQPTEYAKVKQDIHNNTQIHGTLSSNASAATSQAEVETPHASSTMTSNSTSAASNSVQEDILTVFMCLTIVCIFSAVSYIGYKV